MSKTRNYQLVLLLKSDLKKEPKEKLFSDVKDLFSEIKTEKTDNLGEKKLMYPIKKEKKAEYVVMNIEADNIKPELNKRLLIKDEILRHLLVRTK